VEDDRRIAVFGQRFGGESAAPGENEIAGPDFENAVGS
jgi:hypothetical protein